jgi:crotonobetainyl-CoA:carnitine CoA-transferase CaiB-like acyl-CoA transferase
LKSPSRARLKPLNTRLTRPTNAYFGQQCIVLNLKTEAGREVFYQLVKTADVLVENYRPGAAARLGIDYATLKAINPRLIYASISGFGQTGPGRSGRALT